MASEQLKDETIKQRAYELWEKDGRPHGKHDEHWAKAKEEIAKGDSKSSSRENEKKEASKPSKSTTVVDMGKKRK